MLFSSMTFIFMFLPIVCGLYFIVRRNITLANLLLLMASIFFYAWGEPRYVVIMLMTILVNYIGALGIGKFVKHRRVILWATVLVNLGVLVYFKYFNFLLNNVNLLFAMDAKFIDVIMPIGISFYTFQAMSYLIDVYRGDTPAQKNIYKLALYICLFPQLVAGPIVKYHDVAAQIDNRRITFDNVSYGIKRFIVGLAKKMLLANTLGAVADTIFAQPVSEFTPLIAWIGALAYTFQLFYDFSGYSDMAIGLGHIFGFKFLENFNYPYISKSITEFWRRWHISLSTWFKEYLYIPLGGNRISKLRTYLNLGIVFLATGIWHGAAWTFVFWGIWHGLFIVIERLTGWHKKTGGAILSAIQHLYTILIFVIGWVIFRADNMHYAIQYIGNMFGFGHAKISVYTMGYYLGPIEVTAFIVAAICAVPVFKNMIGLAPKRSRWDVPVNIWLGVMFVCSWILIAASTYNPFIYFRF